MPYTPYKKGTLLIPTGGTNHLFGIITDICAEGLHLIVNVTSINPTMKHDPACKISAGEHPFIKHDSYVLYRLADIQSAARLTRMVDSWVYRRHVDLSEELLTRMRDGVENSLFTPQRIIRYFKQQL
jgi:hypothetical protein